MGCPHEDAGLLAWHSPSTWPNQRVPGAGEDIIVPAGRKVLISRALRGVLGLITVPSSSELVFGENVTDRITLSAHGIDVRGALRAGAESCRLIAPVVVTLHGSRPATRAELDALPPTYKGIVVQGGGTLELHGKQYHRTWVRLARAVQPGDRVILLQHAVNWEAGQRIVLTTTALKDARDWHRNEEHTLSGQLDSSVLPPGVGAALVLSTPTLYSHDAHDAWQGEVALLSRMVVVQGAVDDSEPVDTVPTACDDSEWILSTKSVPCPNRHLTGFGAHIFIAGALATARVAGVELHRVGQTNVLGRYPMHFHLMGDLGDSSRAYLRDSSVHRSYYRCVSIHGTHRAAVSQNVAYDVTGHCYYLEDGVETHNVIEYNLAAHIHFLGPPPRSSGQFCADIEQSDELLLPADSTASGFYLTNAQNFVVGNSASGGWAGFSFPTLPHPVKNHRGETSVTPSAQDILIFEGNTAHSAYVPGDRT